MIEIEGSYGSGGGQIIRTAIAMSALTGKPCKITNLRAKRKIPGLAAQHLTGVKAVAELCNAKVKGANLRSTKLEFIPGKIKSGKFIFDIKTAGATTLVLQALLPVAINAPKETEFEIIGGTNLPKAPPVEAVEHVLTRLLSKMGISMKFEVLKYGFFPKGGGRIKVKIKPCKKLSPINLTKRGNLIKIDALSMASSFLKERQVSERQIKGFETELKKGIQIKGVDYYKTLSAGSSIHAHAHFENTIVGAESIGERGKLAENVGKSCADALKQELDVKACVDKHAADQILPFMALAGSGKIKTSEITEHTKTNAYVIEKFLKIKFTFEKGNIISVRKL